MRAAVTEARRWAKAAVRTADRQIAGSLEEVELAPAPPLPRYTLLVVRVVLARSRSRCLTSALVRQAWWAGQGRGRDVVIGVWKTPQRVEAHAWLEGDREDGRNGWPVVWRHPAP